MSKCHFVQVLPRERFDNSCDRARQFLIEKYLMQCFIKKKFLGAVNLLYIKISEKRQHSPNRNFGLGVQNAHWCVVLKIITAIQFYKLRNSIKKFGIRFCGNSPNISNHIKTIHANLICIKTINALHTIHTIFNCFIFWVINTLVTHSRGIYYYYYISSQLTHK